MPQPSKEQFLFNATEFWKKWNFPNAIGCLDGKHIRIRCPKKSGSLYFNYKGYFSIVLFALVDASYKFIAVDVGSFGREGDAGIIQSSRTARASKTFEFTYFIPKKLEKLFQINFIRSLLDTILVYFNFFISLILFILVSNKFQIFC